MARPFLTAQWEDLVLLNYVCPARVLEPLIPRGTVVDLWNGEALVSLVGFLFRDTRVLGWRIPFHHTFEEVNLRFYVRRVMPSGEERRGVVFVRELVPRRAIAAVARWLYNEPYLAVPLSHASSLTRDGGGTASYGWQFRGESFGLTARVSGHLRAATPGSEAEFITEHYWGYTRQPNNVTFEYQVEHPVWPVWQTDTAEFRGPGTLLYGPALGEVLARRPRSAFVALGSEVAVHRGRRLETID